MHSRKRYLVALIALLATVVPTVHLLTSSAIPVLAQATDARKAEADQLLKQGNSQLESRQPDAALQSLQQALALYRQLNDRAGEGQTLKSLGNVYSELKDYEQAIAYQQQALTIAQELQDRDLESRALLNLGKNFQKLGQFTQAMNSYQKALAVAQSSRNREIEWKVLFNLGDLYFSRLDNTKAIEFYQRALAVAQDIKDTQAEAEIQRYLQSAQRRSTPQQVEADRLIQKGVEQYQNNQLEASIQSIQKALVLYREIKDRRGEALALNNLGHYYEALKDPAKAIPAFRQAVEIAEQLNDKQFNRNVVVNALIRLVLLHLSVQEYQSAANFAQKMVDLTQRIEEPKWMVLALRMQGLPYVGLKQYQQASELFQQSLDLARKEGYRQGEVEALGQLGDVNRLLNNPDQAQDYYQQALTIAQELKDSQLEAKFQSALALLINPQKAEAEQLLRQAREQYRAGKLPEAIQLAQQAQNLYRQLSDRRGESEVLGLAGIWLYDLGEYLKAIELGQQRLSIAKALNDRDIERAALDDLGNAYFGLRDYDKAISYLQQSLEIARRLKDSRSEAQALNNLGNIYFSQGDFVKAIDHFQQGLASARAFKNLFAEGLSLGGLGNVYSKLGDYPRAFSFHRQTVLIFQELKDRRREGQAIGNLALVYLEAGDYLKAAELLQQSITIARELKNPQSEAIGLGNLGNVYGALADHPKAIESFQQALTLSRQLKDAAGESRNLGNLGKIYGELKDYAKAIEYTQQSIAIDRAINNPHGEAQGLNNLGLALLNAGKATEAEAPLRRAIELQETLRKGLRDAEQVAIFDTQQKAYRNLQKVLIALNKPEAALEIAERGKAQAFTELLSRRLKGLGEREQLTVTPINITQIKQIAKDQNATLVEYSVIRNENLYIWVIKPTGEITFRNVDLKAPTAEQSTQPAATATIPQTRSVSFQPVDDLRSTIRGLGAVSTDESSPQQSGNSLSFQANPREVLMQQQLKQLHTLLIQPIADLLPTNPDQRVIFVPQGSLFFVPFPALIDTEGKSLIEKHTILTAPSIQVLELTRQQRQRQDVEQKLSNTLLVGNPTMPKGLAPLPGAEAEAKAIAEFLKISALIGNQATKATVVQQMPNATLIHLATHGLLDDMRGLGSAIALAPSVKDDGLLTAEEILDMKLRAELVVLSACDTGKGRLTGDGVIGLSRSLISAGVPSVIVSLWAVPDSPTAFLMTEFYRNLQKNPNKAQALRQAMLTTKQSYNNPINWAAFTLIGEAE